MKKSLFKISKSPITNMRKKSFSINWDYETLSDRSATLIDTETFRMFLVQLAKKLQHSFFAKRLPWHKTPTHLSSWLPRQRALPNKSTWKKFKLMCFQCFMFHFNVVLFSSYFFISIKNLRILIVKNAKRSYQFVKGFQ